jgi:hypothetical protein
VLAPPPEHRPTGIYNPPAEPAPEPLNLPAGDYLHEQLVPAATWIVTHNLGRLPVVAIIADNGELVETDLYYTSDSVVTVVFPAPATGKVSLI